MTSTTTDARDAFQLDNPIWSSLTSTHTSLAIGANVGHGLARRYPAEIGPLSGLAEVTEQAYANLAAIVPEGDVAVLFLDEPVQPPAGWEVLRDSRLVQMICPSLPEPPSPEIPILTLGEEDYPEMVELATLTEPGPFRARTADLGGFVGVRVDGRLAAMAGQRLSPTGFCEVSAVCTYPEMRGRGYAQALVARVVHDIFMSDRIPFLTSFAHNANAIRVYERLGFSVRRSFELGVVRPPARRLPVDS